MGRKGCPETSVPNYHPTLRKISGKRSLPVLMLLHFLNFLRFFSMYPSGKEGVALYSDLHSILKEADVW